MGGGGWRAGGVAESSEELAVEFFQQPYSRKPRLLSKTSLSFSALVTHFLLPAFQLGCW